MYAQNQNYTRVLDRVFEQKLPKKLTLTQTETITSATGRCAPFSLYALRSGVSSKGRKLKRMKEKQKKMTNLSIEKEYTLKLSVFLLQISFFYIIFKLQQVKVCIFMLKFVLCTFSPYFFLNNTTCYTWPCSHNICPCCS